METSIDPALAKFAEDLQRNLEEGEKAIGEAVPGHFGELPMASVLRPVKIGAAEVDIISVNREQAMLANLMAASNRRPSMAVRPGKYARLTVNGVLMMTDTPHEVRTCRKVMKRAHGDVLIAGLGLGMILIPVLRNPKVTSVTVVEKYADVVTAVLSPVYSVLKYKEQKKLNIVVSDIFDWKPAKGQQWDSIWFDIWPDISTDNLPEMAKLHRKFGRNLKKTGTAWMDSWMKDELKVIKRKDARDERLLWAPVGGKLK